MATTAPGKREKKGKKGECVVMQHGATLHNLQIKSSVQKEGSRLKNTTQQFPALKEKEKAYELFEEAKFKAA